MVVGMFTMWSPAQKVKTLPEETPVFPGLKSLPSHLCLYQVQASRKPVIKSDFSWECKTWMLSLCYCFYVLVYLYICTITYTLYWSVFKCFWCFAAYVCVYVVINERLNIMKLFSWVFYSKNCPHLRTALIKKTITKYFSICIQYFHLQKFSRTFINENK